MANIFNFILLLIITLTSSTSEPIQPEEPNCIDCHSSVVNPVIKHEAMKAGCDMCHESNGEAHPQSGVEGFKLAEAMPDLCYWCHVDNRDQKYHHEPIENCTYCHSPHNAHEEKLLITNSTELCEGCHSDVFYTAADAPFQHKAVRDSGSCVTCHSPHTSNERKLLLMEDRELCLSCHNKVYETDSTSILNMDKHLKKSKVEHSALKGGCSSCHLAHGSDFSKLLVDAYPSTNYAEATYENFSLCFLCHDTDLLEAEFTNTGTNFRNDQQNLHYLHINGEKGRSCHLCHNLHASSQDFIIEETVNFGNWKMEMNFLVKEDGGSCLPGCHAKEDYSRLSLE